MLWIHLEQGRGRRLFLQADGYTAFRAVRIAELPGHLTCGHTPPAPELTLKEVDKAIGRFITEDYHQREHPETRATPHHARVGDGWLPGSRQPWTN